MSADQEKKSQIHSSSPQDQRSVPSHDNEILLSSKILNTFGALHKKFNVLKPIVVEKMDEYEIELPSCKQEIIKLRKMFNMLEDIGKGLFILSKMISVLEMSEDITRPLDMCYCDNAPEGNVIVCGNRECPFVYFHRDCVEVYEKPDETWHCPVCFNEQLQIMCLIEDVYTWPTDSSDSFRSTGL